MAKPPKNGVRKVVFLTEVDFNFVFVIWFHGSFAYGISGNIETKLLNKISFEYKY